MTTPGILHPGVRDALATVHVDLERLRASVGSREVTADDPADLRLRLAAAIYEVLHSGIGEQADVWPRRRGDAGLEERLRANVPHERTLSRARLVSREPGHTTVVVELDGVRLRVPAGDLVGRPAVRADQRVIVSHSAARPALSPGFFLVDGSAGRPHNGPLLRLYVALEDPDTAVPLWAEVLRALEAQAVPYQAKILSRSDGYPRRDGLVVYLGSEAHHAVDPVVGAARDRAGRGSGTSVFTEELAEGIARAWEPSDERPAMRGLSFGQHRATAMAEGLFGHARAGARGSREEAVARAFIRASIDPTDPARNLSPQTAASPR
ncbi:T3SS effector HopA1 family protein [Streptomyces lavendulae]|uniref:T3SS effector HopA1 family protein n=1 Tax=Streptomyces lavendulae TaxID=1914 RepID=UPI00380522E7